jgi:signal transduction histidine kinase
MIQALYAIGLRLEYCIEVLDLSPEQVKVALNDVVERLDQLIEVLRGRIYELD